MKVDDLQGSIAVGLGAILGADAGRFSAVIVVPGTFGNECLAITNPQD
jgi:hypothetical protein